MLAAAVHREKLFAVTTDAGDFREKLFAVTTDASRFPEAMFAVSTDAGPLRERVSGGAARSSWLPEGMGFFESGDAPGGKKGAYFVQGMLAGRQKEASFEAVTSWSRKEEPSRCARLLPG